MLVVPSPSMVDKADVISTGSLISFTAHQGWLSLHLSGSTKLGQSLWSYSGYSWVEWTCQRDTYHHTMTFWNRTLVRNLQIFLVQVMDGAHDFHFGQRILRITSTRVYTWQMPSTRKNIGLYLVSTQTNHHVTMIHLKLLTWSKTVQSRTWESLLR